MAEMGKSEFQFMLGERGVAQPLNDTDFDQDLSNLAKWQES